MNFFVKTFDVLPSTNDYLKQHLNLKNHTVIRARFQTAGRGQFDRVWISDKNANILCSFLFKDLPSFQQLKKIESLLIQTLIQCIGDEWGVVVRHKMPNDLYVGTKKLAGFLVETISEKDQFNYGIIGIGLNVNQTTFPPGIAATSLALEIKKTIPIDRFFKRMLHEIRRALTSLK